MERGGPVAMQTAVVVEQRPLRLSARLRMEALGEQGDPLERELVIRAKRLAERRASEREEASTSRDILLKDLKDKKAGKGDLDAYIAAVGRLVSSEAFSGLEVTSLALTLWTALQSGYSDPSDDEIRRKGKKNAALLAAIRILRPILGEHVGTPTAVEDFMAAYAALARHSKNNGTVASKLVGKQTLNENMSGKDDKKDGVAGTGPGPIPRSTTAAMLATCGIHDPSHPAARLLFSTGMRNANELDQPHKKFGASPHLQVAGHNAGDADVAAVEATVFGGPKGRGKELGSEDAAFGPSWLADWCSRLPCLDDSLSTSVAMLLLEEGSDPEMVAASLLDLLGDGAIDAIPSLLDKRLSVRNGIKAAIREVREEEAERDAGPVSGTAPRTYGPTVVVTSESEKLAIKAERKAERRRARELASQSHSLKQDVSDAEWLARHGLQRLVDHEVDLRESQRRIRLGNGFEIICGSQGSGHGQVLPRGTVRRTYKGYEEVVVPPVATAGMLPGEELVTIRTALPEWAQPAFEGYKNLNRIQSRIYPVAFGSNENMLVCAPTGAGKTNIAMLAILREVARHSLGDDPGDFKIVYVAPMKALAAEVTAGFSKRLALMNLGLTVRELTGDMQLSKKEMEETHMIVTTPEKWDVITRKGGEVSIAAIVKLLIIDEVHLLNDERGSVIETLVARTKRQVETSQSMIRIVGLSATLPNYKDVATFLGVNHETGLFYFDASYRPVPLETTFVGISERNFMARSALMDDVCYSKVVDAVKRGFQAMVFVHSRKDTGKTARMIVTKAQQQGEAAIFDCSNVDSSAYGIASKEAKSSRNRELAELFDSGLGIHHAGMLRSDRTLTERLFANGLLKVLCCTATLAWGVNLPAHTVIIKGTQLYNPQSGGFTDLGMLDVQQIFGRAGRPQFQDSGEATIITAHDKLAHYLGMLTHSVPIESRFVTGLADHLNAEIVLGTVTNVKEAVAWLGYTYLFVRMVANPLAYGISWQELAVDPVLEGHRRKLVEEAARELHRSKMARFDEASGNLYVTELGRVASHFYIRQATIETWNEVLKPHMTEADLLGAISKASEFENLTVRDDELLELDTLARRCCPHEPRGGSENKHGKANILLQAFVSRSKIDSFSLVADTNYVASNAPRLARALFQICLRRGWPSAASMCLSMSKACELQLWPHRHPLWQFERALGPQIIGKLEDRGLEMDQLIDMSAAEIGAALRHPAAGPRVITAISGFPRLEITAELHPVTRTVLQIRLDIVADFRWRESLHGAAIKWHVWVEDSDNEHVYHSETWTMTKRDAILDRKASKPRRLEFAVPIFEPLPPQYYVRIISDSWLGAEHLIPLSLKNLLLPERHPPPTELLDLDPLPVSALKNSKLSAWYARRFSHFNPIQTQAFHTLYHTDENVLLGAPTGSGKTISAELTLHRLFAAHPGRKVVYIAPLKALVRERMKDWVEGGFAEAMGVKVVELTGDFTPDLRALYAADIVVATPEKWDGISRAWKHSNRSYVGQVGLMIMDEIHLLGTDRGPALEVIVSRMRLVADSVGDSVRFVGLSTALANAVDLADWLGVNPGKGLFNFKPSVRPVPLECHVQGYPGAFYCPRMATMNKPAYAAIQTYSPTKPVLVFVSSRRQTRLTALDLIAHAAADGRPRAFIGEESDDEYRELAASTVKDAALRHTLQWGVGLHHAGLTDGDRTVVEQLFVGGKIRALVATSTLAWGVNTPAHLVIVKGTEYYDAPTKRYVDYPITDVLQMIGRAGRPQYDRHGVAVVMVHEPKKSFYKKFLYDPFPVESSLPAQFADHLNAEIAAGTINSTQDAVDYLTWTFFLRRLLRNPSYYGLESTDDDAVSTFLSTLVGDALQRLEGSGCVIVKREEDSRKGESQPDTAQVIATTPGRIAAWYYLRHETIKTFEERLGEGMAVQDVLETLAAVPEYDELPVRHNEDLLNARMMEQVRFKPTGLSDDPHVKASLLLQAHLSQLPLPVSDYITDTKSVLDNSLRIMQAMVDYAADAGWADTTLAAQRCARALVQGKWHDVEGGAGAVSSIDIASIECRKEPGSSSQVADTWRILLEVRRVPQTGGQKAAGMPRFSKNKEEGCWISIVDKKANRLLALKRISFGNKENARRGLALLVLLGREDQPNLVAHVVSDTSSGGDAEKSFELR